MLIHPGIIRAGFAASSLLLLLSCSKLDKDSNCLNDKSACFKEDKTRPQFSNSTPAAGQTVSTLDYIDLTFSEELKNPQPSDFSLQSPGNSLSIARVEKLSGHVYRLWISGAVQNGQIVFGFDKLRDYNGNFASGSLTITGNVDIGITFDKDLVTNPGYREGVSSAGGTAYSSTTIRFKHDYQGDVANGNDWKVYRTTGITACSGPGVTLLGGFGSATLAGETFVSFTLNQAADFPGAEGYYRIVVCINNAAKNKFGAQGLLIARDNSAPSVIINPYSLTDEYRTAQSISVSCSDNASKIAYRQTAFNTWTGLITDPADPADPDFTVTGNVDTGGGSVEYTGSVTTPGPSFLGDTINPVRSKYKFRCVDKAGNKSAVSAGSSPVYVIDNTLPEVTISLTGAFRDFITNNIPANNSTTISFTTNQPAGQTYKIIKNGTSCDVGGTDMVPGSVTQPAGAPMSHTFSVGVAANQFSVGVHNLRICVRNPANTKWGVATLTVTRDDSVPVVTPNVASGTYGSLQSVELTCSDNKDKLYVTSAEGLGATVPTAPADPVLVASEESSGLLSPANDRTTIYKWICRDKAGQISTVGTAQYTIDTVIPAVTIVSNQYPALSSLAAAFQSTNLVFHSTRGGLTYRIMRGTTDCVTTATQIGTDQTVPAAVNGVVPNVTVNLGFAGFPSNGTTYDLRVCVYNNAGSVGYNTSTLQITRDDTPPTLPIQTPTIAQVDATNFTVSWNASSDANGIAGYRIFRRLGAGAYGASPDYTAVSTSATIAMPDTQPYFLKIVPFDVAGNVPAAGASYTEITTKPTITLVVTGLGSAKFFNLTDGTSSATISANTAGSPWTTSLSTGGTYNFRVTLQPNGQVCAVKELQFGALDSGKTFNINCADGYMVGGTFQTQSAAALNYDLYRGNTSLVADAGTTGMPGFNPGGIAFTSAGTMYVSDPGNSRILRVTSSGTATVLAGSGTAGTVDGLGVAAQFFSPSYMASDGTNLYVSQVGATITTTNNGDAIRKIDSTGNVTTLVSGAQAIDPEGITISGHLLYWANRSSHQIKSLNLTSGVITVIAGSGVAASTDGTGTGATFNQPMALVELKGKLYVTEFGAHKIRVIDIATQNVNTLGGGVAGFSDGAINLANFNGPSGIATDGFDLYVADYYGRRIRRIRLDRTGGNNHLVSTVAGSGASASGNTGTGAAATFIAPVGIATNGRQFFISDEADNRVRMMTDAGLVGYWLIDPGVNPNDYSSSGAVIGNGTVSGGSLGTTVDRFGTTNAASTLNGTSQYITVADSAQLDLTAEYSISVWINPNATASNRIVDKTTAGGCDGYMIDIMSKRLRFLYCSLGGAGAGNVLVGGATVETGKWTHVTATFSNSARKARLYYNGHLDAEFTTGGAVTPVNALPVRIGVDSSTAGNFFSGAISDVRIYNRALSEGEINELAQDALASQVGNSFNNAATGLLAHYTLANSAAAQGPVGGSLSPAGSGAAPIIGNDGISNGANYYDGGGYHYTNASAGLPLGNAPRTHCGWVRPANLIATGQYFTLLQYGLNGLNQKAGLWLRDNAGVKKLVNGGGSNDHEATFNFPINAWTHVCNTYDGTNSSLYANGRLLDTASFPAWNTQSGSLGIGRDLPTAGFLTGGLQDIRIYNNALSAIQIRQLATQVPAGLAARYDMIDAPSGGTANDVSGSGISGTVTATATHSGDRFLHTNQSYLLNGTSQHIMATGPATTNTDTATLAAWVRWGGTTGAAQVILNNGETSLQGYTLFLDNSASDRIRILCGQVGFADTSTAMYLPVNVWTHLAMVRDTTPAWTLYVNGAAVSVPTPCTPNAITSTSRLSVGANAVGAQFFKGDVDDARVYHRALTAAEVRALAGYHPMQVTNALTSMKMHLQPDATTRASGGCAGGANCVSAWNDSSGNAFNVSQSTGNYQPVFDPAGINGRSAIKFIQASKTFLSGTCAAALNSANNTIFSVFNEVNQTGNNGIFQNGAPLTGKLLYFISPAGRTPALFDLAYNAGAGRLNLRANANFNSSAETVLMALDFDGAAGNMYKNGSAATVSVTSLASSSYNCGAGTLDIGRYYWGPVPAQNPLNADNFDGFIGDFIYFDQVLSPADRLSVNCYLSAKYNLPLSGVTCP